MCCLYLRSKPMFNHFTSVLAVLAVLPVGFLVTKIQQSPLNSYKITQNLSKSIKINQILIKSINFYQNQCKSIKINPNHAYMHQNHQRKRKSNSLLRILGLLVSHV